MRRLIVTCFIVVGIGGVASNRPAAAQPVDVSLTSERRPVRISVQPLFQRYDEDGQTVSEWSVPLHAVVPLGDDVLFGLRTGLARADGSNLTHVTGLGDVQASLSYTRSVGAGSVILHLGANLPSGAKEFTLEEFETMTQLSRNVYAFRMPGMGQGFNVTPGATWAVPVGEHVMLGVGASYRLRGRYTPLRAMEGDYNPGDEVQLTGGVDVQLGTASALSGDVTLTLYGDDTIDGVEQYGPGRKLSLTAQYLHHVGFNVVRAVVRYQSQAKSRLPVSASGGDEAEVLRVLPNQGSAFVTYRFQASEYIDLIWRAEGRFFGETATYARASLFSVGAAPAFSIGDAWTVRPQFAYTFGSFTGLEAGLGFAVAL